MWNVEMQEYKNVRLEFKNIWECQNVNIQECKNKSVISKKFHFFWQVYVFCVRQYRSELEINPKAESFKLRDNDFDEKN